MRGSLVLIAVLGFLATGCKERDDLECDLPPPPPVIRVTLTDTAGTDLLKGGQAGFRVTQACRTDTPKMAFRYSTDPLSGKTLTVLNFESLLFTAYAGNEARPECFQIVFTAPSLEQDVLTWSYRLNEGGCRTPVLDEVRFNGQLVVPEATPDKAYFAYHLIRRR